MGRTSGVVIGRFQVPRPHAGHVELLTRVHAKHDGRLLILVGYAPGFPCAHDPIPVALRVAMLQEQFPDAIVGALVDQPTDVQWSGHIDFLIRGYLGEKGRAVLYGGRDNALSHYCGVWPTKTLTLWVPDAESATQRRRATVPITDERFLSGLVHAQHLREGISYQTVDVVIEDAAAGTVLLGQKPQDGASWRLVGGFVSPQDDSLEMAAAREAAEEVGSLGFGPARYLGSHRIDDYRYRGRMDGILTALFVLPFLWGAPKAADDLAVCAWFSYAEALDVIAPMHRPLLDLFLLRRAARV